MTVKEMYTLEETIAKDLFEGVTYPWEVLPKISSFILELGASLPEEEYEKRGENVWVARSAKVAPTAFIGGPAIIGKDAEVRHCAFIRGNAIVGEGAVVGNSTELKNVVLFNKVQFPHYNYVGDSVLGYKAHMGAGSITSNVKSEPSTSLMLKVDVKRFSPRRRNTSFRFCVSGTGARFIPHRLSGASACDTAASSPPFGHFAHPVSGHVLLESAHARSG